SQPQQPPARTAHAPPVVLGLDCSTPARRKRRGGAKRSPPRRLSSQGLHSSQEEMAATNWRNWRRETEDHRGGVTDRRRSLPPNRRRTLAGAGPPTPRLEPPFPPPADAHDARRPGPAVHRRGEDRNFGILPTRTTSRGRAAHARPTRRVEVGRAAARSRRARAAAPPAAGGGGLAAPR